MVSLACRDGGGCVNGKYFRFVYLDPKGVQIVPATSLATKKSKQPEHQSIMDSLPAGPRKSDEDGIMTDDSSSEIVDVVGVEEMQQVALPHQDVAASSLHLGDSVISGVTCTKGSILQLDHHLLRFPKQTEKEKNNEDRRKRDEGKEDRGVEPMAAESHHKKKLKKIKTIDLSAIRPLKTSSTRFKKYIELSDIVSGEVLVCFRGSNDAADALGIEKRIILKACTQKRDKTSKKNRYFDTFRLR